MYYDAAIKLAVEHEDEIVLETARRIKNNKVAWYADLELADLAQRLLPSFHLRLRYLQTGDLTEWREYVDKLTNERSRQGIDYLAIIKCGEYTQEAMLEFFQKELPLLGTSFENVPTDRVLQNINSRLQGLKMVGDALVVKVGINNQNENTQK